MTHAISMLKNIFLLHTNTLPTHVGASHQWTIPTSMGHFRSYFSQWEPLVATSVGTLRSLVANTSRCGEGINYKHMTLSIDALKTNFFLHTKTQDCHLKYPISMRDTLRPLGI